MASERKYFGLIKILLITIVVCIGSGCKSKDGNKVKPIVIHFSETTGWDHKTRDVSQKMFKELSEAMGFELIHSNESEIFDQEDLLQNVGVVIFSNTTGEDLLTPNQQKNFERYVNAGGDFIGIHSASDTHRSNWEFYSSLVGAILQVEPWHTASDYVATMEHMNEHKLLEDIPNPWTKEEEYYYWDLNGGRIDTQRITPLLKVERTGPLPFDRKRLTTWYQELPSGTKSFYTSLGHSNWNYENPKNDFRKLIRNALEWTLGSND